MCRRIRFGSPEAPGQSARVRRANALRMEIVVSSKLFVGGLSWDTTDQSLNDAFAEFGTVTEAKVIHDRDTGRSRGFGFVTFDNAESARAAVDSMNDTELDGRNIRVDIANERR